MGFVINLLVNRDFGDHPMPNIKEILLYMDFRMILMLNTEATRRGNINLEQTFWICQFQYVKGSILDSARTPRRHTLTRKQLNKIGD
jgi:hypothetical protein